MRNVVSLIATLLILTGCSSGNLGTSTTSNSSATTTSVNTSPTISGSPAATIQAGNTYFFKASVQNGTSSALTFAIQNKPIWASFDSAAGTLSGMPTVNNVGTTSNIQIS